jgi:hypothetical protein
VLRSRIPARRVGDRPFERMFAADARGSSEQMSLWLAGTDNSRSNNSPGNEAAADVGCEHYGEMAGGLIFGNPRAVKHDADARADGSKGMWNLRLKYLLKL